MTPQATIEEAEELRRALESYLDDLRIEIATTDAWGFIKALNERRNVLRAGRTSPVSLPRHANGTNVTSLLAEARQRRCSRDPRPAVLIARN